LAILVGLLAALIFVHGCANEGGLAQSVNREKQDLSAEDAARFLAGLHGRSDGWFAGLERTPAWQSYAALLGRTWGELDASQFQRVRTFQERELSSIHSGSSFVFYPFSGPDVLYATLFFPNCRLFVLAGLEPAGSLRTLYNYRDDNVEAALRGWRTSLSSLFFRSFFVTGEMDREFRGRIADGLLLMILLLLVRSGHSVDGMAYGSLSPSGEFVMQGEPGPGAERSPTSGVEIEFHRENDSTSRTLYYFSIDLTAGFGRDPRLPRFLQRFGMCDTLLKSASFLPHWRMCNSIRNYILENSNLVLQDDTGVPFRDFEASKWDVQLFGAYSHPDRPFQREYQRDLAKAFQAKANVRELGFSLGYGAGRRSSSLMLAQRIRPLPPSK
jgi:hypothetical protein